MRLIFSHIRATKLRFKKGGNDADFIGFGQLTRKQKKSHKHPFGHLWDNTLSLLGV